MKIFLKKVLVFSFIFFQFIFLAHTATAVELDACYSLKAKDYVNCLPPATTVGTPAYVEAEKKCSDAFLKAMESCPFSGTASAGFKAPLVDPLVGFTIPTLINNIIKSVMGVVGAIALILFIYSGVQWMTARGNPEQVKSATKTMMWTAIGIVVLFSSYLVLDFIFKTINVNTP